MEEMNTKKLITILETDPRTQISSPITTAGKPANMDKINPTLTRPTASPIQELSSLKIQHALTEIFGPQLVKDFEKGEVQRVAAIMERLNTKQAEREFVKALEIVRKVEMSVAKEKAKEKKDKIGKGKEMGTGKGKGKKG